MTTASPLPPSAISRSQGWLAAPVGLGAFTVEADRQALGQTLEEMIARRKAAALGRVEARGRDAAAHSRAGRTISGELVWYRVLHAATAQLLAGTGREVVREGSLEEWLRAMRFESALADDGGPSPLHFAVLAGRVDLAAALLDSGADVNARLRRGFGEFEGFHRGSSPLKFAMLLTHDRALAASMVRLLVGRRADPGQRDAIGSVPMHYAAGMNSLGAIDALLSEPRGRAAVLAPDKAGCPALAYALEAGSVEALELGLQLCPDEVGAYIAADKTMLTGPFQSSLIQFAAAEGSPEMLRLLIRLGCAFEGFDPGRFDGCFSKLFHGCMAPGAALFISHAAIMLSVVDAAALHAVVCHGHMSAVRVLLDAGANVDSQDHYLRRTPVMLAAWRGHEEIVAVLLAAGARTDLMDRRGVTAAQLAARGGYSELAERLTRPRSS